MAGGRVMGRRFRLLMSGLASLLLMSPLLMSPASATGDGGCTVEWKLNTPAMTGCSNLPALGPGNDTRVNLLLLLFDRHGTPPERPSTQLPLIDPFADGWRGFRERFSLFRPRTPQATPMGKARAAAATRLVRADSTQLSMLHQTCRRTSARSCAPHEKRSRRCVRTMLRLRGPTMLCST